MASHYRELRGPLTIKYTITVQSACAKVLSSSRLRDKCSEIHEIHDMQNQVACRHANVLVSELPLLLSFTSSTEMSGSHRGSCLRSSDTPFRVRVARWEFGIKGFGSLESTAIPPMMAQKLCVNVHGWCLVKCWFSGSVWCSSGIRDAISIEYQSLLPPRSLQR